MLSRKSRSSPYLRSASAVADLVLLLMQRYAAEKGKGSPSRLRLSLATLYKLSGREILREAYLDELENAFRFRGWGMLRVRTNVFLIDMSKAESWLKLSSRRVADLLEDSDAMRSEDCITAAVEREIPLAENDQEDEPE